MPNKYLKILINNLEVDLPSELPNLELTYSIKDKDNPENTRGSNSERSLTLPATKQNDLVFDSFWDVGRVSSGANFKTASIQVNGLPILQGKAQLNEAETKGKAYSRKGLSYDVAFFGNNADWFLLLKDKLLGLDLDWQDPVRDITTFKSFVIAGGYTADYSTQSWCCFLAKWKDWTGGAGDRFEVLDSTFALFIRSIIDKIFDSIGYTVSSQFFDTDEFKKYILAVPPQQKYPAEFGEDYLNVEANKTVSQTINTTVLEGITYDNQTVTPPLAPTNPFTPSAAATIAGINGNTSQYQAPETGFYQVFVTIEVDNIVNSVDVNIGVLTDGAGSPSTPVRIIGTLTAADNGRVFETSIIIEMAQGDIMEFYIGVNPVAGGSIDIIGGSLRIIGEASIGVGASINFRYLLRNWAVTDFIKGLTQAFNLYWDANPLTATVTVEPKDPYLYKDRALATTSLKDGFLTGAKIDMTHKIDLRKNAKVMAVNSIPETSYFVWGSDSSDPTMAAKNLDEDIETYGAKYVLPPNRFEPETVENRNPFFAPTLHIFDRQITDESSDQVAQIPIMWPMDYQTDPTSSEPNYEVMPRLLYFAGRRAGLDGYVKGTDNGFDFIIDLPCAFFVNYNDPTGLDPNLSFSNEAIQGNIVAGLLERFRLRDMARNRAGKGVQEWLHWNETDILNLDFRQKITLDGYLFVLQEVSGWSPLIDRSTKTYLQYDAVDEQQDSDAVESSLLGGFVNDFPYS